MLINGDELNQQVRKKKKKGPRGKTTLIHKAVWEQKKKAEINQSKTTELSF